MKQGKNIPFSERRYVELVVLSDVHLGTYGCHARELVKYLRSIQPGTLVLNGDIIDMWQFSKKYFPKAHMKVLKEIINMASKGVDVVYITGNHDELLRKFAGFSLGKLRIENKLLLDLQGKKAWIFHGDVFDVTMQYAKWLTRLGAVGYDTLILVNTFTNFLLRKLGREKISLSKKVKNSVKSAVKFINNFEETCADIAIRNKYDYVICGHIHHPEIREIKRQDGSVLYLNSGDWIENLTALEYDGAAWSLYHHTETEPSPSTDESGEYVLLSNKELFSQLVSEIHASANLQPSEI